MKLATLALLIAAPIAAVALDRHFDLVGRINSATATFSSGAQAAVTPGAAKAPQPATPPLRKVRIVAPKPAAPKYTVTLPGRTAPLEQARISARAPGIVAERFGEIGDRVKAGDVLVEIDAPEVRQALDRAKAAVAQVEARLVLAKVTFDRAKTLVPKQYLPEQTLDDRRAAVDTASADLEAAKAEVRRLEQIQGFQTLRAPFDGVIIARQVERGDRVGGDGASTTAYLYNIARLEKLRIEVDVPQSLALKIVPGIEAKMIYTELPGKSFEARVDRTSQAVDAASSTMRAELLMDNPGLQLPAGLNVQVAFEIERAAPCVLVPGNALLVQQGKQIIAVAEAGDTIAFRNVMIGRDLGNDVEVCSGLTPEDRVIMSPNALLKAGDKVEIIPPG
jgi:RND family efflux transporter MFP subunit